MLGRQVALVLRARLPRCIPTQYAVANDLLLHRATRNYATPGRPRKSVGEPSKPVKRAVKRAALATDDTPAAATTKTTRATKSKAAPKKKTVTKKKTVPKKELTPEELVRVQAKADRKKITLERAKIKELKTAALDPPFPSQTAAYICFFSDRYKARAGEMDKSQPVPMTQTEMVKSIGAAWRDAMPAEVEHWNHEARIRKDASITEFTRWVASHPAEEIRAANRARALLKRKIGTSRQSRIIQDERTVKRPLSSFLFFVKARQVSGDFANIVQRDVVALMAKEWHALSAAEKKKYQDLSAQDQQRYHTELGQSPPPSTHEEPQAAAAAAAA